MELISTISKLKEVVRASRAEGKKIGVVPTMGALHEGHLSLARDSLVHADETIATIFLNPTQFAAGEDLGEYPKTLEKDVEQLEALGVKYVFAPSNEEVYPPQFRLRLSRPMLPRNWKVNSGHPISVESRRSSSNCSI